MLLGCFMKLSSLFICPNKVTMPPFRIYLGVTLVSLLNCFVWAQTNFIFSDVSQQAGITATHRAVWEPNTTQEGYLAVGQTWGDYDNDSWVDLYVTGNLNDNVLYKNNGDGTFSVSQYSSQVNPNAQSGGAIWADYNNDGWNDLCVLNFGKNTLFRNNKGKGFVDVTDAAGVGDTGKGESAIWGDYDNDGFLDLYVVNWACLPECGAEVLPLYRDRLYHNNGDGTFTDVTDSLDFINTVGAGCDIWWETFQEAADEAGQSRRYGGIHFQDGDLRGRELGKKVAEAAYNKAEYYWLGE
jgi:enediyne biosynthesis protein E4